MPTMSQEWCGLEESSADWPLEKRVTLACITGLPISTTPIAIYKGQFQRSTARLGCPEPSETLLSDFHSSTLSECVSIAGVTGPGRQPPLCRLYTSHNE